MELTGLKISMDLDLDKLSKSISVAENQIIGFSKQLSSAFKSMPDLGKKLNINVDNISAETSNIVALAEVKKLEAQARQTTAKAILDEERARKLAEPKVTKQLDEYGKLTSEMNKQVRAYLNAAANLHKLGDASEYTAEQVAQMAQEAKKGQEALLKMESAVGRNQRNVGNYASGWDAMGHSINQITRELPAFTYSMQTGFMAISNNIPAVADAIQGLNEKNKQLAAQGKATIPVWKQLASSLLSWQTLMSLGITLLTVYGEKIYDWATGADKAKKAEEELKKAKEQTDSIDRQRIESVAEETSKLRTLSAIVLDTSVSIGKRNSALAELQKAYPAYLSNMTLDMAMTGQLANIINNKLIPAILATARARAYEKEVQANTERILENEKKIQETQSQKRQEQIKLNKEIKNEGSILRRNQQLRSRASQGDITPTGSGSKIVNELAEQEKALQSENFRLEEANATLVNKIVTDTKSTLSINENTSAISSNTGAVGSNTKSVRTLADVQAEYNKSIEDLDRKKTLGLVADGLDYFNEKLKINQKYLSDSTDSGISGFLGLKDNEVNKTIGEIININNEISKLNITLERKKVADGLVETLREINIVDSTNLEKANDRLKSFKDSYNSLKLLGSGSVPLFDMILNGLSSSVDTEKEKERLKGFREEIEKIFKLQDAGFITTLDASNQRLSKYNEELKRAIENGDIITQKKIQIIVDTEQAKNSIEQLNSSFSKLALDTATRVPEEIGKGIGDALTGRGSLFGSFISMLGDQLQELGKIMIKFGTIKLGIDTALQSIALPFTGGLGAIAAGVASVAAGQIIKASASKRTRSFASGGIVYDETYARVGEYANAGSNPEIIAPLNKLTPLISNAINNRPDNDFNGAIALETRVSGTDLLLLLKRAEKQYNR